MYANQDVFKTNPVILFVGHHVNATAVQKLKNVSDLHTNNCEKLKYSLQKVLMRFCNFYSKCPTRLSLVENVESTPPSVIVVITVIFYNGTYLDMSAILSELEIPIQNA